MAISNYLMSRLAAVENARQLSLQTEQARAAREAAGQRATTGYLQQLLGAGTQLATSGYGISKDLEAAQAAKDLEDMDLQAKIQAARDAELTQGGGAQVDPVTGQVVPAAAVPAAAVPADAIVPVAANAIQGLFPDQPKDPSMDGGVTRRDPAVSPTDFKSATPIIPSAETLPADATRRPGTVTTAVSPLMPTAATVTEADLAGQKTGTPAAADIRRSTSKMGVPATAREGAEQMLAFPEKSAPKPETAVPAGLSAADIAKIRSTGVAGANITDVAPSVPETALQGAFTTPPGTPIPGYRGINIQDITSGLPQQTPAVPAVVSTIPTPTQLKQETNIDLSKPKVREAVEQAPAITGYKPLSFANAKSPQEEAKRIVDQVWKKQPPGNPLTAFFNHGKNTGQMDQARRMAELKAELTIRDTRKQLQAEHESKYLNSLAIKQREEQINLIRAQSVLATSKSENTLRLKTNMPNTTITLLEGSNMARQRVQSLKKKTDNLLNTTGNLPIGRIRQYQKAVAEAAGYNIGSSSSQNVGATIAAKMGIGASATTGATYGKAGRQIDQAAYKQAMESMDKLNLSPDELAWLQEYDQTIQVVGKAREGGKMTDKDQANYEKMLISSQNGRAFLNSLNDLGETQIGSYNRVRDMTNKTYDIGDVYQPDTWEPLEWDKEIGETPLAQAAMLPVPGPVGNQVAADIAALRNLLNDPNVPPAAKVVIEAEIAKKSAAANKPRQASPSTQPAADPFN